MRILLDECVPRRLRTELPGHVVSTVHDMAWSGKKNGELLQLLINAGFEVFLTIDQNLRDQQNLKAANVSVLVLIAPSNRPSDLLPLMPAALAAIPTLKPGDVVEISGGQQPSP